MLTNLPNLPYIITGSNMTIEEILTQILGIEDLSDDTNTEIAITIFNKNISALTQGISDLKNGSIKLNSGLGEISNGSNSLKNGTIELDSNINHSYINDTINEYLSKIPENYSKWEEDERLALNNYLSLKELPSNKPKLFSEIKEQLLQKFSKEFNKNLTQINTVFLT
jgi:X-X-X-Leu-X-X-Gly heptad repeat protein